MFQFPQTALCAIGGVARDR